MTLQAGAHIYNKMPPTAFDSDWGIGNEPALRWFCRACDTRDELTDHQACGTPSYDPRRETVTRRDYMLDVNSGEFNSKTKGVYFTPNLFYRWRNQKHLNGIVAHWLEIDTKGHNALTEAESKRVLDEVADVLWRADLPMATSLVTTGSGGVHLYWMYDEPQMTRSIKHRETLIERWREISKRISTRFEVKRKELGYNRWSVDYAASHNPSGNMRLPSSLHHKTWREVEYYRGGKTFVPQELVTELGFEWDFPQASDFITDRQRDTRPPQRKRTPLPKVFVRNSAQTAPQKTMGMAQGFDSNGQQYWMRGLLQQLTDYLAMAKPDLRGKRDLTAFHIYNMANRVMGANDAWNYIQQTNKNYIGLTEGELKAFLSTANSTVYYYGMRRLTYILGTELSFPLDFSYTKKPTALDAKEVTRRRSKSGRTSSRKKRSRTLDKLVAELYSFIDKNKVTPSQIKVSKALRAALLRGSKLTRATFYRHLQNAIQVAMSKVQMTLADIKLLAQNNSLIRSPLSYNAVGDSDAFFKISPFSFSLEDPLEHSFKLMAKPPD